MEIRSIPNNTRPNTIYRVRDTTHKRWKGTYLVLCVLAGVSIHLCHHILTVSQLFSLIISEEEKINVPYNSHLSNRMINNGVDNGVDNDDTTVVRNKATSAVPVGNKNAEAAPIGAVIIKTAAGATNIRRFPEDDEDRRPWVIVHVGPEKTATTTIQKGLYTNAKMLAKDDNFYFVGHHRTANTTSRVDIGDGVNVLQFLDLTDTMGFSDVLRPFMQKLHKLGHHAILSAEHFTNLNLNMKEFSKQAFLPRVDTGGNVNVNVNVNDTNTVGTRTGTGTGTGNDSEESLFQFRVKIVVTYRHFFEWLPSLYYQHYLYLKKAKKYIGLVPYMEKYLDRLVQYDPENNRTTILTTSTIGGRSQFQGSQFQGGMDDYGMQKETSHLSVYSYLKWSSMPELSERVEIFDLHQQLLHGKTDANADANNDVFADFVCQMLPSASNTCRHLMEAVPNNEAIHERSSSTKSFLSTPERNLIIHDARFLPEIDLPEIDFHTNREIFHQINKQIGKWFRRHSKSKGLKICLGSDHTHRLKVASWNSLLQMVLISRNHALSRKQKDDSYYTSFVQSSRPTDHLLLSSQINTEDILYDDSWIVPTKAAHDASFDAFVAKGKLCSLNATKLLEDKDFVRYVFGQYYGK